MPKDTTAGKPATRSYSPEEKAAAVRMVRTLRVELATEHGTLQRVASQLGYGTESVAYFIGQRRDPPSERAMSARTKR